ncbi:MAG: hypothetical protein FJ100_17040 [Deltaproteobacteria bacterium]|nr:hypothetical protein [Deltaproteobacteria bacterium]
MRKIVAVLVALGALTASPALAGERDSKVKGKGSGNIRVNDADKGVQELDLQNIEGRIYKPSVFYVLARSEVKIASLDFRQSFIDRVYKGALKRPF